MRRNQTGNVTGPGGLRPKTPTGIEGFDEITHGGLPTGRTTLVMGEPGAGKTLFALQALASIAREQGEAGIFVAFEERVDDILANAAGFGWEADALRAAGRLVFIDAHVPPDVIRTGDFDFNGLLALLRAKCDELGARLVVFDALDVVLRHLNDRIAQRQEIYRLQAWLVDSEVTGLVTASIEPGADAQPYSLMHSIADCVIQLTHRLVDRVLLRELRVLKYRGSAFLANEFPLVIGPQGLEVAAVAVSVDDYPVSTERVSSGIKRLDDMLGGGYLRGSSILITGAPGTAVRPAGTAVPRAQQRVEVLG